MGVTSSYAPKREVGNGSKVDFDFDFKIFEAADLKVYKLVTATGVATLQTLGVDYTLKSINTTTEGGTITYTTAPTALQTSWIGRNVALTQPTDIPSVNIFREVQVENGLDRGIMIAQQLSEESGRTLQYGETVDMTSISTELPTPVADKYLGFNSAGTAIETKSDPTASDYPASIDRGLDAAKAASPSVGDLYLATDTGIIYQCLSAGSWSDTMVRLTGAQTVAGVKTFSSSPIVPTPTTDMQASTKKYVDDNIPDIGAWVDISSLCTESGWEASGFTLSIKAKKIVDLAVIVFTITGTSDAADHYIELPAAWAIKAGATPAWDAVKLSDGSVGTGIGLVFLDPTWPQSLYLRKSSEANLEATGTVAVNGTLLYEVA